MTNDDRPSSAAARKAGRPTPEAAREISSRITAAAEDLFVELGYERTTMDEVARRAQVSKRTLYARFPGKDDLFLAAVERGSDRKIAELEAVRVRKGALPLRLEDFARKLVAVLTEPRFIAFERIMAAEAGRFPAVTAARSRSGIERVSAIVSRVLREDPPFSAMDTKELMLRSQIFLAMAVLPLVRRALYGEPPIEDVDSSFMPRAIEMFLAGNAEGRSFASEPAEGETPENPPAAAESRPAATGAAPRRRASASGRPTTRDRILAAAMQRFARGSYDNTGLRDIAADVGVDVAYVHRSFGSKEALFAQALDAATSHSRLKTRLAKDELPRAIAELFAQSTDLYREKVRPLDIMIRSMGSPAATRILSRRLGEEFIAPISLDLDAPQEIRATMIASLLLGIGIVRDVLQLPALTRDTRQVASFLEVIVEAIVEADCEAPED